MMFLAAKFLIGLAVIYYLPIQQAKLHFHLIDQDGNKDSLKEVFHFKWFTFRLIVLLVTAVLVHYDVWMVLTYVVFGFTWFGYSFTPKLNRKRGLANYYVSKNARASYTDRFLLRLSRHLNETPEITAQLFFEIAVLGTGVLYFGSFILYVI